jgi:hypothetical protein
MKATTNGHAARNGHAPPPTAKAPPLTTVATVDPAADVRDNKGRFGAGNKAACGNPFNRRVAALRKRLVDQITDEKLDELIASLFTLAKAGDIAAAKLLLTYSLGKPDHVVDPDGVDQDEWERLRQAPFDAQVAMQMVDGVSAPVATRLARSSMDDRTRLNCDVAMAKELMDLRRQRNRK